MPQKLADYIANSWRHLARGHQFFESSERFLFDGEKAGAKLPSDPGSLRAQAVRLFAMAIQVRETEYADGLIAEAVELQDEATAMEQAAKAPPNERGPLTSSSQGKVPPADLLVARTAAGSVRHGLPLSAARPTSPQKDKRSAPLAVGQSTLLGRTWRLRKALQP
jgi:hypothetical protein